MAVFRYEARDLYQWLTTGKDVVVDVRNRREFVDFIKSNMRPQPEEYAKIRLVNANLLGVGEEEQNVLDIGKNECTASAYAKVRDA